MTVLMTATVTDGKSEGVNLCTVILLREKTMKKRNQVWVYGLQIYLENLREKKKEHEGADSSQAMMLRMAGQEIPEEGHKVEEFLEVDDK